MTKMKSLKKALITSAVSMLLCSSMFVGTTYAWFTDSVTSNGNVIQTGTLNVGMYWAEGDEAVPTTEGWTDASTGAIFNNTKWEPGYAEAKHVKIVNEGTLALKYKLVISPNGEVSELADVIDVYFLQDATQVTREALASAIPVGTLAEMIADPDGAAYGYLLAEDESTGEREGVETVTIALKMRESAGNEYMGDSIGADFSLQLIATQYIAEEDGFDNQYDKDVEYPVVVSTAADLRDAMKTDGANIVLTNDITVTADDTTGYGQHMFLANGKDVTIDLNGKDITLSEDASHVGSLFSSANGGSITIKGNGNVEIKNGKAFVCWAMNATDQINIYGGNYFGNGHVGNNALIYVQAGKIDVYGGKFTYPVADNDNWGFNAHNSLGNNLVIEIHEDVLLQHEQFQYGDDSRIQLAEGCSLEETVIDGVTWYKVVVE